jgi:hypothetical protein
MSKSHKKIVKSWDLFEVKIEGLHLQAKDNVRFVYGGKCRAGTVERIGEREDGSHVVAVETQDGPRNFDADMISELSIMELV